MLACGLDALLPNVLPVNLRVDDSCRFGSQLCTSASPASSPDKSTIRAPLRLARSRFRFVKPAEPAKKIIQAFLKLSSSTGWMMAGSPPASVRSPATDSSSTRRKSQAAKLLSSKTDLSSAPSSEDAPAITTRRDSRAVVIIRTEQCATKCVAERTAPDAKPRPLRHRYTR